MPVFNNASFLVKPGYEQELIDKETGCNARLDDYQQCRQVYYAKKQTELMQRSASSSQIKTQPANQTCDYSEYQSQVDALQNENQNLRTELDVAKTKYKILLTQSTADPVALPTIKQLYLQEVASAQNLIFLLGAVIVLMGYSLLRKKLQR